MAVLPWVIVLVGQGLRWVERELEEDALPYLNDGTQALVDEVARIKAAIRKAKGL